MGFILLRLIGSFCIASSWAAVLITGTEIDWRLAILLSLGSWMLLAGSYEILFMAVNGQHDRLARCEQVCDVLVVGGVVEEADLHAQDRERARERADQRHPPILRDGDDLVDQ